MKDLLKILAVVVVISAIWGVWTHKRATPPDPLAGVVWDATPQIEARAPPERTYQRSADMDEINANLKAQREADDQVKATADAVADELQRRKRLGLTH